jgi:pyruvate carboxylase
MQGHWSEPREEGRSQARFVGVETGFDPVSDLKPIRCLAIVNRGEAAMRCIRAVKSLRALEGQELRVAAMYTAVDRAAPFVRHADVAVQLPVKTTPVAAYLDHELLLNALRELGADAVWPGWGFVAESPEFVDRLTQAGIRFLGPTAKTMRALGDKISSKQLAERSERCRGRFSSCAAHRFPGGDQGFGGRRRARYPRSA